MEYCRNLFVDWCHAGISQGNALFGAILWGRDATLNVTFNRADYWFYSDNLPPGPEQSYETLKHLLQMGDELELKRIFGGYSEDGNRPPSSTRLPMGRLKITPPESCNSGKIMLNTRTSLAQLKLDKLLISSIVPRNLPVMAFSISGENYPFCKINSRPPDAENVKSFFENNNFPLPKIYDDIERRSGGWLQNIPNGKTLCVRWQIAEKTNSMELFLAAALENSVIEAEEAARKFLTGSVEKGFAEIAKETSEWWSNYWEKVPKIKLPDQEINELYELGMYRFAGLCAPGAPAATLQGPWVEDDCMPPWSCDYHFNINVQECYWPAFAGNLPEFIMSLFKMIKSWEPVLRKYAKNFVGIEDGLMLPHATDDRGFGMGGFWPGHIDHSCTAWIAQLMWLYWRYTGNEEFLRETLYPFMDGVMNVYVAMLEKDAEGNLFIASESSPEYNENSINAWGRNPSIHLAAIHFLSEKLLEVSEELKSPENKCKIWREVIAKLPKAAISADGEICVWDGQPLEEPHRHFSHLAALHPFDLLDWRNSREDSALISKTIPQWIKQGTGLWSGWSFPWASIIYSRLEMSEAAHTMLSMFRRGFMKDDYALRYLPDKACFTSIQGPPAKSIMQIEAGMASAAAVLEMCVHCSQGILYPFAGIPDYWPDVSFSGIRTEGTFLISGIKKDGIISQITVSSCKDSTLKIAIPKGKYSIFHDETLKRTFQGPGVYESSNEAYSIKICSFSKVYV